MGWYNNCNSLLTTSYHHHHHHHHHHLVHPTYIPYLPTLSLLSSPRPPRHTSRPRLRVRESNQAKVESTGKSNRDLSLSPSLPLERRRGRGGGASPASPHRTQATRRGSCGWLKEAYSKVEIERSQISDLTPHHTTTFH